MRISMPLFCLADAFHDKIMSNIIGKNVDFVYLFRSLNVVFLLATESLAVILITPNHMGYIKEYVWVCTESLLKLDAINF